MTRTDGEVEVLEILPDAENPGISKVGGWIGYVYRVTYRLADGSTIGSTRSSRLLRDAKAELASLPKTPEYPTRARFHDGRLISTVTEINLGRLVGSRPAQ